MMIEKMDDYLIHQSTENLEKIACSNPLWQDRFFFSFFTPDAKTTGLIALGQYPNIGQYGGDVYLYCDGQLYTYSFYRPLEGNRGILDVPPVYIKIVKPWEQWDLSFKDPKQNIDINLCFQAIGQPYEFKKISRRKNDELVWDQCHYTQPGTYQGHLKIGENKSQKLIGLRDRSWGIRNMCEIDFWLWCYAKFEKFWVSVWLAENQAGEVFYLDGMITPYEKDSTERHISKLSYDVQFHEGKRTPKKVDFTIVASEETVKMSADILETLYDTPADGQYDLKDSKTMEQLEQQSIVLEQICQFHIGDEVGYGMVEFFSTVEHHRYPENWKSMEQALHVWREMMARYIVT